MVARGHAWLLGGGVVAPGGACVVAPGGACMVAHVWLLWGGMCGCSGGGHVWLLRGGACVVALGRHAFTVALGGVNGIYWQSTCPICPIVQSRTLFRLNKLKYKKVT